MGISNVVGVSSGLYHTCVVQVSGLVKCWGWNTYGELGDGTTDDRYHDPVTVIGINDALSAAAGSQHVCALSRNGVVRCWGDNGWGQLGNGSRIASVIPVAVNGISNVVAISENCAAFDDGFVQCWGYPDKDDDSPYEIPIYFGLLTLPTNFSAPSGVAGQ